MKAEKAKAAHVIPGCPDYLLTEDFKITRKNKKGFIKGHKSSKPKPLDYYWLTSEQGQRLRCRLPRIAWAIAHNVKLYNVPYDIIIDFADGNPGFDNFIIRSRSVITAEIRLRKNRTGKDPNFYERCREFAGLVAERNVAGMYTFMERYSDLIIESLSKRIPRGDAERAYPDVVNDFVLGVLDGRYLAPDPVRYIRKYATATADHYLDGKRQTHLIKDCLAEPEEED